MTLFEAIHILARAHTRDDPLTGYTIDGNYYPRWLHDFTQAQYFEAWGVVRRELGMTSAPAAPARQEEQ